MQKVAGKERKGKMSEMLDEYMKKKIHLRIQEAIEAICEVT